MDVHPPYEGGTETATRVAWPAKHSRKEKEKGKETNCHPDQEAIDRLRNYVPPPTAYSQVPLSRRAAVLILLYADPNGNLRVVITMRAKTLSSCTYLSLVFRALCCTTC